MAELPVLEATSRDGVGKGAARQARRDGYVPGVVYGGGEDPVAINIRHNVLLKSLKAGKFLSTLINLKVDDGDNTVICRGVQRDVVRDLPIHADFQRLSSNSRISLFIPVEFENEDECPGLRQGGNLTVVRNEVELKVTAGDIPQQLTVDLTGLEIGDTVKISDIALPSGTSTVITGRDFMIATIAPPTAIIEEGAEDDDDLDTEIDGEEDGDDAEDSESES